MSENQKHQTKLPSNLRMGSKNQILLVHYRLLWWMIRRRIIRVFYETFMEMQLWGGNTRLRVIYECGGLKMESLIELWRNERIFFGSLMKLGSRAVDFVQCEGDGESFHGENLEAVPVEGSFFGVWMKKQVWYECVWFFSHP